LRPFFLLFIISVLFNPPNNTEIQTELSSSSSSVHLKIGKTNQLGAATASNPKK
jgi:hypothetical protein